MDFDWKAVVRTVAPGIASVFGTPLAGMGVTAILNAIMPPDEKPPDDPEAFLSQQLSTANPEMLLKIKQAEHQFRLDMEKAGIDLERLHAADRDSARQREVMVRDSTPKILAYVLTAGYFTFIAAILFHPVPKESERVIDMMLGSLSTVWIGAMTYYHGSSAGSALKDIMNRFRSDK